MQVTKNITLDLLETGSPVIIKAKQNDRNTRYIAAHLYVDGLAYPVPSGTEIAFRYKKPDGTAGFYDALPDNSPAITVSGNTVTVELVEQVLTAAGCVHCEINMYNAASEKLTTFTFEISVEESVLTDAEIISSDYYNVLTAEIAKALQAVTDATEQAENAAQSAQDAADSAAMSKDWAAGQPVTYSGTPVSIAYAGANRIASITAYGENAQGGTTEAPVALTGISSVTVNDDVTELPIPRPLHKVGDVRDVCRTRVKSVYDKRIVLDGTEIWTEYTDENWQGAGYHVYRFYDADALLGQPIVSNKYPSRMGASSFKGTLGVASDGQSILFSVVEQKTVDDWKAYLAAQKKAGTPVIIYRQSTAYDGTNGLDVCLTEYQTGFAELDGKNVQASYYPNNGLPYGVFVTRNIIKTNDGVVCSQAKTEPTNLNWGYVYAANMPLTDIIFGLIGSDITSRTELNAYLAAQKEAGTPVQVAYQLAAPEVYATDPLDIDNAAGPLNVMTGGELEVRMTELVGSRSDVSNNTVAFSETAQDADIASGEKLSVLFGKIKKRFSVLASTVMLKSVFTQVGNPNLLDNSDFTNPVNQRGATSYSGAGTYCIDRWDISSTATVSVVADGIKISATTLSGIRQKIENITDGQLLVFQLCDNADTVYTQAFAASTTQAEYTTDFGKFRFVLNSGGVLTISILLNAGEKTFKWAKLEKGSVATPYVPKGYGAELAECQRYFKRVGNRGFRGWATNETNVVCCLTLATQMRVNPTITPVGTLTAYDEVSSVTVTMDSSTGSTVDTARITAHGTGLTAFRPYSLLGNVDISADL